MHLACFQEACGVPVSQVQSVFGRDLDIVCRSVCVVWVEDVVFEPVCSGVVFGVDVMSGLPCLPGGLGRSDCEVAWFSMWAV